MGKVSVKNPFKTMYKGVSHKKSKFHRPEGAGNFDNMDDRNFVQSVNCLQGTINHTPANPKDIANKSYCDSLSTTPAGSNGEIQFNDSGSFGADSQMFWDKVNKRLGLGTSSPDSVYKFHLLRPSTDAATRTLLVEHETTQTNAVSSAMTFKLTTTGNMGNGFGPGFLYAIEDNAGTENFIGRVAFARKGADNTGRYTVHAWESGSIKKRVQIDPGIFIVGASGDALDIVTYSGGHLGIGSGAVTPSQPVTSYEKACMTQIGGFAIKLTNQTGGNTVQGQLVRASFPAGADTDDAFEVIAINSAEVIGIVLEAGVSDGSEAWVVISGIADVLMDDGGSIRGDRMISSPNTAGSADVWNVGGAVATHFQEIGHCIETRVGAGLARCILHFN